MHQVVGRTRIEATTLKTVILNNDAQKLYVTMRDKSQVGVIDPRNNTVEYTWSNPELNSDFAIAYTITGHRLFVGDRNPGKLLCSIPMMDRS